MARRKKKYWNQGGWDGEPHPERLPKGEATLAPSSGLVMSPRHGFDAACEQLLDELRRNPEAAAKLGRTVAAAGISAAEAAAGFARFGRALNDSEQPAPPPADKSKPAASRPA
jgi:hypothetical protein